MPDLVHALDELRRFAATPPVRPSPLDEIERGGHRLRMRRRARTGAVTLAAILVVVGVAGLVRDDAVDVRTSVDPADRAPTSRPATGDGEDGNSIVVTPDGGLVDGQVVRITGDLTREQALALAQCASEAADAPRREGLLAEWCDSPGTIVVGREGAELAVARVIDTPRGRVDCAERPARCVIGLASGALDRVAPISFRDDLGAIVDPAVALSLPSYTDGELARVTGSGFAPGSRIAVTQCTGAGEPQQCDQARQSTVTADGAGRFEDAIPMYREIHTPSGWMPCEPCVVQAGSAAPVPVDIEDDGAPDRPVVRIVPDGPYAAGQLVSLEGGGFGVETAVGIGWCGFLTDRPDLEIEGDPSYGYTPCNVAFTGEPVVTGGDGRFSVEIEMPGRVAVPSSTVDCAAPETRCGFAWHPMNASVPVFVTLFDIVG